MVQEIDHPKPGIGGRIRCLALIFVIGTFLIYPSTEAEVLVNPTDDKIYKNVDMGAGNSTNVDEGARTDVFIMLPGIQMDKRNKEIFDETHASALEFYPDEYVHIVYNTGDPTYLKRFPNEEQRDNHLVQHNNFGLGGFAAAAGWMEQNRPTGNFVTLQHSVRLTGKATAPACDIELVNMSHRCGFYCKSNDMLTGMGAKTCFPFLNEKLGLFENYTCGFPCCTWDSHGERTRHFKVWPLMAHNSLLFTPRARGFLKPLINHMEYEPPNSIGKGGDMGTERLFGIFSTILLEMYGSVRDRNVTIGDKFYADPVEAYIDQRFACYQDITMKTHGGVVAKQGEGFTHD